MRAFPPGRTACFPACRWQTRLAKPVLISFALLLLAVSAVVVVLGRTLGAGFPWGQQLADLFRKIQSLGGSNFAERVQDLPETVEKIRESGESALSTAGTVWDSIRGFFRSVAKTLSAIFGG